MEDFSTGGRQFGWFTAGVSILATYISAMTFIGMPGWVYWNRDGSDGDPPQLPFGDLFYRGVFRSYLLQAQTDFYL